LDTKKIKKLGKTILIFGGGDNQRTLIIGAKELGYRTVVIDPNEKAIGKKYADIFELVEAKDYEKTKEIAEKYQVKGIVTCQMENPLLMMAKLAEEKNYRFPSIESIGNARDKYLMKQAFLKSGVPCAKGFLIADIKEIYDKNILFPAILKPVDAFSSRGVYKVNCNEDIEAHFTETQYYSSTGNVIIEEFIEGPEFSVESVTNNEQTYIIQITQKEITPFPNTVEMAHIQPAELTQNEWIDIETIVKNAISALGINNCASHAELKLTANGPKMIEIGARLGGDYITSHLVPLSTDVNIEKLTVQIAMNDFTSVPAKSNHASIIRYLNLKPNKLVKKIAGWQKIFENKNLIHADINIKENEYTKSITDSAKRAGFVIVKGTNRTDAIGRADELIKKLESYIKLE